MSNMPSGLVLKLFISTNSDSKRVDKSVIAVDKDGVLGDKFYNKDSQRSILIASTDSYNLVSAYNIEMPFGYLGENILIDYNPYSLAIGTRVKIGNTVLEISQNCTICNHLSVIDKRIPSLLKNDRGIFAKVVEDGEIKIDDSIYILES
ncbi:MAG: hypothetical protein A2513_01450 [Sulfurimonas sp. RIFOXYD12_FULL_33_39]|uniref:MOSC domain-containing protein n=1 Tax=unclassified Sulfurimonas TaxID=2623549 RepID=UPI0008B7932A|nr:MULTISPECIES: MOSC domain-containing protein [unclassified Sulfurimonas]OHE06600.1 MAG: hypothetical protein A3G74_08400 [Sulfurimonas sp. RIFCSPLOWO2_12_FULL_34_6]OHE10982.1 MAG: hypothetical protein A2513_01450 [Sulfurimonas sp. RIFOXYD12_FULL_33_39]OHE13249.1 MAG: hypothetical protein A2530_06735 [Sulfurimonas sp. RIFOXYD2_FULL_34_21]